MRKSKLLKFVVFLGRRWIVVQHELTIDGHEPNLTLDAARGVEPLNSRGQQSYAIRGELETRASITLS